MSTTSRPPPSKAPIELRSGTLTIPVLRLRTHDVVIAVAELATKVQQSPEFFRHAPLMVELSEIQGHALDFAALVQGVRDLDLVPVGVRAGDEIQHQAALTAGLVVFAEGRDTASPSESRKPPTVETRVQYVEMQSLVIDRPVRSGQRIYAQGGDLIVLAPVSSGAEIMADGHIHVYSTLRGRALAGVRGDLTCRIFCHDLQADLVSIAGHYRISEHLDEKMRGKSVQVYLKGESLIIEPFP